MQQVGYEVGSVLVKNGLDQGQAPLEVRLGFTAVAGADQVVEELHDGGVRLLVIERAGQKGALDYGGQGGTLEERNRGSLKESRAYSTIIESG